MPELKQGNCTVRFYVLPDTADVEQRLKLACTLVEKAAQENLRVFILCADQQMVASLNTLLWSFKADSFIPHCPLDDELAEHARVWLAAAPARINEADVLINLSLDPAVDIPRQCTRVLEIVTRHQDVLHATRSRFATYRRNGLNPQTHQLR